MGSLARDSQLAPGFLVASPGLRGEPFERSVVLVSEATADGAMGFIVNQPMELTLGTLADDLELEIADEHRAQVVWAGGPVRPEQGWLMVEMESSDEEPIGTMQRLPGRLIVAASLEALGALLETPKARFRLYLGYAGWGEGQLEEEVMGGSWISMPFEREHVFYEDHGAHWDALMASLGLPASAFWSRGAGFA